MNYHGGFGEPGVVNKIINEEGRGGGSNCNDGGFGFGGGGLMALLAFSLLGRGGFGGRDHGYVAEGLRNESNTTDILTSIGGARAELRSAVDSSRVEEIGALGDLRSQIACNASSFDGKIIQVLQALCCGEKAVIANNQATANAIGCELRGGFTNLGDRICDFRERVALEFGNTKIENLKEFATTVKAIRDQADDIRERTRFGFERVSDRLAEIKCKEDKIETELMCAQERIIGQARNNFENLGTAICTLKTELGNAICSVKNDLLVEADRQRLIRERDEERREKEILIRRLERCEQAAVTPAPVAGISITDSNLLGNVLAQILALTAANTANKGA